MCLYVCTRRFGVQVCNCISSEAVRDIDMKPKGGWYGTFELCHRLLEIIIPSRIISKSVSVLSVKSSKVQPTILVKSQLCLAVLHNVHSQCHPERSPKASPRYRLYPGWSPKPSPCYRINPSMCNLQFWTQANFAWQFFMQFIVNVIQNYLQQRHLLSKVTAPFEHLFFDKAVVLKVSAHYEHLLFTKALILHEHLLFTK